MTRAQLRAEEHRWRRGDLAVVVSAVVVGAVLAWILLSIQALSADLRTSNEARDQLAQQVQQLGGHPVAGPPGSRGEPGPTASGPQGEPGVPGQDSTVPGPAGSPGPAGRDSTVPGPAGPAGAAGANGAGVSGPAGPAGPAGAPGADSTVPGPTGPKGEQGQPGRDGRDGQTCPDGYSLQPDPTDPNALECRRDSTPTPTPADNPLGLGAMAVTALYRRL